MAVRAGFGDGGGLTLVYLRNAVTPASLSGSRRGIATLSISGLADAGTTRHDVEG